MLMKTLYQLFIAVCLVASFAACKSENVVPAAQNIVKGIADDTEFTATNVSGVLNNNVYTISGAIENEVSFQLFFQGNNFEQKTVASTGPFFQVIEIIDDVISEIGSNILNPNFNIDSATTALNELYSTQIDSILNDSTTTLLQPNECFVFYNLGRAFYYSKEGNMALTSINEETMRFDGDFDFVLNNLQEGEKPFSGNFEDVQYTIP